MKDENGKEIRNGDLRKTARPIRVIRRCERWTVVRDPDGVHVIDKENNTTEFGRNGPDADRLEERFK